MQDCSRIILSFKYATDTDMAREFFGKDLSEKKRKKKQFENRRIL